MKKNRYVHFFSVLLLLCAYVAYPAVVIKFPPDKLNTLAHADSLFEYGRFEESHQVFRALLSQEKDHKTQVELRNKIIVCLTKMRAYDEAIRQIEIQRNVIGADISIERFQLYYSYSELLSDKGDYWDALQKVIQLKDMATALPDRNALRSKILHLTGKIYSKGLLKFNLGIDYLDSAFVIYQTDPDKYARQTAAYYFDKSAALFQRGDYAAMQIAANQALDFYKRNQKKYFREIAKCKNQISIVYGMQGRYPENIQTLLEAISIIDQELGAVNPVTPTYYDNLGVTHWLMGDLQSSLRYYRKSVAISGKVPNNSHILSDAFLNMGECFLNDNRTDSAKYYYRRALALRKEYFKNKHADIAVVLMHLGDLFMVQSNIDSALYYYQQAMIHEVPDFNSTDIRQTPAYVKGTGYVRGFVFLISSKAKALLERFTKKDDLSDLKQSFILYSLADSLLLSLRKDYNWEDSRYAVSRNMRFLYEDALQAAWLLSQREDSEIYPAKAFHLMENSKNTLLLEQVRDAIPKSSYKAREVSLKRRIEEITINLQLLNRTNSGTSQSKVSMEIELSQLQRMLQHYYDSVGQFGKSQISVSSISLFSECLKKMSNENAGLLEFYMGDRNVYGIGLAKDKAIFFKVPLTQNLENELQTLFDATRRPPDFNNIKSELDLFSKASATVYGKLFSPFLSATNGLQKLTIIPEGKLALLPPEILLTDSVSNNTDFRSLPYLVRKFNLHLAYSFSILQARETTTQNIKRVTTFSGEYESKPIPGAVAEIKAIAEKFDVKEFSGRDASRQNFLEEALHATALHLAVHGRGDKLKELDSYIMFSDDERDKLYAKELYHLNMNASLIVLASCESGAGVMKPGEGILSLARSFAYAGCPAIVVNLWEAPDFASYQILNRFYDHLSQNEPIAKAISQAKRDYLQSADEAMAHPFYWSGLALTGNVNYQDNEHTIVWFASISLALLLTFIIYRKYS